MEQLTELYTWASNLPIFLQIIVAVVMMYVAVIAIGIIARVYIFIVEDNQKG